MGALLTMEFQGLFTSENPILRALVTMVVGHRYQELFERCCRESWTNYACQHDLNLIVLNAPIDRSERAAGRPLHWQKCLILDDERIAGHSQVAWVDADIVINPAAPSVFDGVAENRFGAVDEFRSPDALTYRRSLAAMYLRLRRIGAPYHHNLMPEGYYRNRGFPELHEVVQTGVFVCSPLHHRDFLRGVYTKYATDSLSACNDNPSSNYEMGALSYELLERGLVDWIDERFNRQVLIGIEEARFRDREILGTPTAPVEVGPILCKLLADSYFLHFAGCQALMEHLI